jgi:hypothetical protein
MIPPHQDPVDYDPNEPNRMMVPVSAMVGSFRFDGMLRMSTQSNLFTFLEVIKEVLHIAVRCESIPAAEAFHGSFAHTLYPGPERYSAVCLRGGFKELILWDILIYLPLERTRRTRAQTGLLRMRSR